MEEMTVFEAAHIIGCDPTEARQRQHLEQAGSTAELEKLEAMAADRYPWKQHTDDSESYWVTVGQAAKILDLSVQRVKQLLDEDRLPYLLHRSGVRLMRRQQIDVVANARQSRELQTGNS